MGSGGGSGSSRTTSDFAPWSGQQPYLKQLYQRGQALSETPLEYYPGQTVAGQSPETLEALQRGGDRARQGSPLLQAGQQQNLATVRGDYLNSNPYLDATFGRAAEGVTEQFQRAVLPQLEARFARAGRTGSPAYGGALQRSGDVLAGNLAGLATDIYGGNYQAERGRQERATAASPALAAADYGDIERLGGVGQQRESFDQNILNDLISRFDFGQQEPWQRLGLFQEALGGPISGGGTTKTTNKTNPTLKDYLSLNFGF